MNAPVAILTADMRDFSTRMQADEVAIIDLLTSTYYRLAQEMVDLCGGVLFRREGDAIWCRFDSAEASLQAGLWLLSQLQAYNQGRPDDEQVLLRVGVHFGPDGVETHTVAKKLESSGRVGRVHISSELLGQLTSSPDFESTGASPATYLLTPDATLAPLSKASVGSSSPRRPYKFLSSYGPDDRAIFFGRDSELRKLRQRFLTKGAPPYLVLYGKSGVGKTSLLRAGLESRLDGDGQWFCSLRLLSDPVPLLRKTMLKALSSSEESLDLAGLWSALQKRYPDRLVLVLDQFEELFVRCTVAQRQELALALAQMAREAGPRCHLVISLREDFLAEMCELEAAFPEILKNRLRLTALTNDQARECIVRPAELFGLTVQAELVDELVMVLKDEGIHPPELQIILDRLDRERQGEPAMLLEHFRRLGGASAILGGYLDEALREHLGPDSERARKVLKAMLSDRQTKAVVAQSDLLARVNLAPETLSAVLRLLVDSRLVRVVGSDANPSYELAHDTLVEKVASWQNPEEVAQKHAQLIVKIELRSFKRVGSLIPRDRLKLLMDPSLGLQPNAEERFMLVRAAVLHGIDPTLWMETRQQQEAAAPRLLVMLADTALPDIIRRSLISLLAPMPLAANAIKGLLEASLALGNPTLLDELSDDVSPQVRVLLESAVRERFFGPKAMTLVEGGPCWVGSTRQTKEQRKAVSRPDLHSRIDSERDYTEVEVAAFRIDRLAVSNKLFAEFVPMHVHFFPPDEGDYPVVNVSYDEALAFARWMGKRLPSEIDWEKAARGCDGRLFPWGNSFHPDRVNSGESGRRLAIPVDALPDGASPYGCLQMAGNVWEWTTTPWGPDSHLMAKKGGCALNSEPLMHCSARFEDPPEMRLRWAGFRLVSDVT